MRSGPSIWKTSQPAWMLRLLISPINEMHLMLITFFFFYFMGGGDARRVHLKKILKSLQKDRRVKTIVGLSWFLPQQRHLSAKVSCDLSVSSFVEVQRSWFAKEGGRKRHRKLV